eukprot:5617999-Prymnesium_polylepis.1
MGGPCAPVSSVVSPRAHEAACPPRPPPRVAMSVPRVHRHRPHESATTNETDAAAAGIKPPTPPPGAKRGPADTRPASRSAVVLASRANKDEKAAAWRTRAYYYARSHGRLPASPPPTADHRSDFLSRSTMTIAPQSSSSR